MVNLGEATRILELHREGLTISAIAERTGKDRKTVRKYIRRGLAVPSYKPREVQPRVMDPFLCYVKERVTALPELTASRLLRELRELGYAGGRTALGDVVRAVRRGCRPSSCASRHLRSRPIPKVIDAREPKRRRGRPPKEPT